MDKQAILEQVYNNSFDNELVKISSKHLVTKIFTVGGLTAAGALSGIGYGNVTSLIANIKAAKEIEKKIKEDIVPAKTIIKKYAPDVVHIGDEDTAKKNLSTFKRIIVKPGLEGRGAFYVSGKKPIIVTAKNINKSILGHEIGHHFDRPVSFKGKVKNIFRSTVKREQEAWDKSPIKVDPKVKDVALGTYKTLAKHQNIGALIGALTGAGLGTYLIKSL